MSKNDAEENDAETIQSSIGSHINLIRVWVC